MKKSFLFSIMFFLLLSSSAVFAESWDDYAGLDRIWDGQTSVTNKEFEEVMNALEEKKNKKNAKLKKKQIKKIGGGGTSLHNELNPDKEIKELAPLKKDESEEYLLNIPVNIIIDEEPLEKGFYRIIGEKDNDGNIYLMFYQSQFFKGKIKANETNDDFDEKNINFVKLIPYNENFVKIIFGSLDFNAWTYVQFVNN